MVKKYSPAHVKNPSSMQHLVRVCPGQPIHLFLDREDIAKRAKVEISGDNMVVESSIHYNQHEEFRIEPKPHCLEWSPYSSCLLGEVWIETSRDLSKLMVIQECPNKDKNNYVTVVNPDCYDLRVLPHNIIEVVLYDLRFSYNDEWSWSWKPVDSDLDVDILGKEILSLYYIQENYRDDPAMCYAMCPRVEPGENICRQHHMWFRFNHDIVEMAKRSAGICHVGDLNFVGCASKFMPDAPRKTMYVSVYVDFRKSKAGKILRTLGMKKSHEYPRHLTAKPAANKPPKYNHQSKGVVTSSAYSGGVTRIGSTYTYNTPYKAKPKPPPTLKQVVVKKVEHEDLDFGCKVLSAQPSATSMLTYDEYDILRHFGYDEEWLPGWKHYD